MPAKFGFTQTDSDEFRFIAAIERGSRDQFAGRYKVKPLIDCEILAGWADPDEMEYERSIERSYRGSFFRMGDVENEPVSPSVGDAMTGSVSQIERQIDFKECSCDDGKSCIICCTHHDLMAFPLLMDEPRVKLSSCKGRPKDFEVRVPLELAQALGFI